MYRMNRRVFSGFLFVSLFLFVASAAAQEAPLTAEAIREAFASWSDETGEFTVTDPEEIKWERGSFTRPGADEVLVSF